MKKYFQGFFNKAQSNDSWSNNTTGIGAYNSRVNSTRYVGVDTIDVSTLSSLYRDDGIAKRIVDLVVDDALRGFIEAEDELLKELFRLNFKQKITECAYFARLYGGAAIVAFSDDGGEMDTPINFNRLRKVVKLVIYDRRNITWDVDDVNKNYYEESYGEPNVYTIHTADSETIRVHRSRCCFLGGTTTTDDVRRSNGGWDDSVLQPVYDALLNYGAVKTSSAEVVQDYNQKVLSVSGLDALLASGGYNRIKNRIKSLDLEVSNAQMLVVDSNKEKYEKHTSSASGLADLWDKFAETLSATTGIPMSRLFGLGSSGLNNNSDNDVKNWHDVVEAYRVDQLTPCIEWMVEMVSQQSMWLNKDRPKDYDWYFSSLDTPNEEELAKVKLLTAQVDNIYVGMGAIDARALYSLRYSSGSFQTEITIPDEFLELDGQVELDGNEDLADIQDDSQAQRQELYRKISERL